MPNTEATLIKLGQPEKATWSLCRDGEELPEARPAIVPLALWQAHRDQTDLAPWLGSDTVLTSALVAELHAAPLVAIDFPAFTDGRGYSLARLLRERHGYTGEIRAIGDVLVDQLFYMTRCGFDALALRDDQHLDDALRALGAFSVSYQPGVDVQEALFERRLREANLAVLAEAARREAGEAGEAVDFATLDPGAASELGDVVAAARLILANKLRGGLLGPGRRMVGYLYFEVADYDRARITMVDVATGEIEGFLIEF